MFVYVPCLVHEIYCNQEANEIHRRCNGAPFCEYFEEWLCVLSAHTVDDYADRNKKHGKCYPNYHKNSHGNISSTRITGGRPYQCNDRKKSNPKKCRHYPTETAQKQIPSNSNLHEVTFEKSRILCGYITLLKIVQAMCLSSYLETQHV